MPYPFIDTHAHLYDKRFDADRSQIMADALRLGMKAVLLPNIDTDTLGPMLDLVAQYPNICYPMLGLHPCHVVADFEAKLDYLSGFLGKEKFVAIGEVGLDFFHDTSFAAQQQLALETQISWAKKYKLPLALHTRNATSATLDILEKSLQSGQKGVFHCWSGTQYEYDRVAELGFYIGIGGVASYTKSGVAEFVGRVGLDRVVLETDAPYLAPHPKRSRRNEPAFLAEIIEHLALILNQSPESIALQTSQNAQTLFALSNDLLLDLSENL